MKCKIKKPPKKLLIFFFVTITLHKFEIHKYLIGREGGYKTNKLRVILIDDQHKTGTGN